MKKLFNLYKKLFFLRLLLVFFWLILFLLYFIPYVKTSSNVLWGNVIFVLDLSNSMNVKDVFYNSHQVSRLELAKKIIENNINNLPNNFWLIVYSNTYDYLISPTLDKKAFLTYLNWLNTYYLNWWKTDFQDLLNNIPKLVDNMDTLVFLSDFDFPVWKIKLSNPSYFVALWTKVGWIVKSPYWKTIFKNDSPLVSSLNFNTLKKIKESWYNVKIIKSYKKWEVLDFLKQDNSLNEKNWRLPDSLLSAFVFILLAL